MEDMMLYHFKEPINYLLERQELVGGLIRMSHDEARRYLERIFTPEVILRTNPIELYHNDFSEFSFNYYSELGSILYGLSEVSERDWVNKPLMHKLCSSLLRIISIQYDMKTERRYIDDAISMVNLFDQENTLYPLLFNSFMSEAFSSTAPHLLHAVSVVIGMSYPDKVVEFYNDCIDCRDLYFDDKKNIPISEVNELITIMGKYIQ